ncbi:MAG: tetratricopeptide repeat protein [Candidatus Methanoperedens sp.]
MRINIKSGLVCGIIIFIALSGAITTVVSESVQLQWTGGVSGKLMRGEALTYKGYSVEVIAFPAPVESSKYKPEPEEPVTPFVGLNISKNGKFISSFALGLSESYVVPDGELKVTAKELPAQNAREWIFESYAPWAIIELNPRGTPRLDVSIQTDKDKYTSSYTTDIVTTVKLDNTGSADAVNVDMAILTELPIKRGNLKYHYDKIKPGESITESLTFSSPILTEQKTTVISANVSGYDVMAIPYTAKFSKSISIAPEVPVSLVVRKSTVDKMYLKDYTIVSLSVKNNGRYDANNVNITDYLPEGFRLLGSQSLNWVVDLPAGGEWDYHYTIRPTKANKEGVVFPAATAEFTFRNELYSQRSNQPRIVVYGPGIILTKQTDVSEVNPGDIVTVTVIAENTGSTPTRVSISDTLPDKVTLISGSTVKEGFLEATRKLGFNYTLRIDSNEPITLPPATAEFFELGSKGRRISTNSQEVEINIKSFKKIPTPTPSITTPVPTPAVTLPMETPAPTPVITAVTPTPVLPVTPPVVKPVKIPDELLRRVETFFLDTILACNDTNISGFTRTACNFFKQQRPDEPGVLLSIRKSTVDSMLLKDYTSISLSLTNNGTHDLKNVNITDSLPEGFRLLGNQSLQWVVDIPAGEMREYRYLVRPQEPSKEGIRFPAATAKFIINSGVYTIQSNKPTIVVYGASVVLRKQTDVSEFKPGDSVNVTVLAENTGNAPTSIVISDNLPEGAALVSGKTTSEGVLEANMKMSFNYTLRIGSIKPIKLPPASAEYYEYDTTGRKLSTNSQELKTQIKSPTKIIETQALPETPGKRISESEFLQLGYFLIALMLISFVLYKLWNYRKVIKVTEIVEAPAIQDQGKNEEAIKAYDKDIEINPENADAWYNKGFALYELGKYEEATKAYDKAKEIIQRMNR